MRGIPTFGSAELPGAPGAPPPDTSARLIGQVLRTPRLLTGGCSCLSARQEQFRNEGAAPNGGGGELFRNLEESRGDFRYSEPAAGWKLRTRDLGVRA